MTFGGVWWLTLQAAGGSQQTGDESSAKCPSVPRPGHSHRMVRPFLAAELRPEPSFHGVREASQAQKSTELRGSISIVFGGQRQQRLKVGIGIVRSQKLPAPSSSPAAEHDHLQSMWSWCCFFLMSPTALVLTIHVRCCGKALWSQAAAC